MKLLSICLSLLVLTTASVAGTKTRNVFLITVDGLRWQEVFKGAEELLMNKTNGGVVDTNRLGKDFWRSTVEERRTALLPFFWNVIGKQGQLYGNQSKGSAALLTNGRKFTYPGFNEILAGFADDRINKNEKRNNPNVTALEWLHQKAEFTNRVVAFANWDVFPYILNTERSGIPMWTGYDTNFPVKPGSPLERVQRMFDDTTPLWPGMNFDSFYLHATLEHLKVDRPRIVWTAFSEPDEWAHEGRYDLYLYSAHYMDRAVRKLWDTLQSMSEYRDQTTLILTCDHGRGSGPTEWKNHGAAVEGAEGIWIAILGPDTPPLGERTNTPRVGQNQIAATLSALLGHDYRAAVPKAGPPIGDALAPVKR